MCHTAIVLSKEAVLPYIDNPEQVGDDTVILAHSYATIEGPHISFRKRNQLLEKDKITVVSPVDPKEDLAKETAFRDTVEAIATQFSLDLPSCRTRPQTCSNIRLGIRPLVEPKFSSKSSFRKKVAKGLVDYILGYPRIEKFDKHGKPIAKASFCAEFVHSVYQIASFYTRMSGDEIQRIQNESLAHLKKHPEDLQAHREKHVQYICDHFDEIFPDEALDSEHWTRQKSVSFAPGRLFTVMRDNGNDCFTAVPE